MLKNILTKIKDLIGRIFQKDELKNIDKEALEKFRKANLKQNVQVDEELLKELGYEDDKLVE